MSFDWWRRILGGGWTRKPEPNGKDREPRELTDSPPAVLPQAEAPPAAMSPRPIAPARMKQLEALKEAVESHLPVLPVVDAQLLDANRQMEEAVSQVGANFGRIVARAREGANEASRMAGTGQSNERGVDRLLAASRSMLESLMDRIMRDAETCRKLIETIDSLRTDLGQIVRSLAEVDDIASNHTILALNAKIEAVHVGARGAGFGIVAQEISTQAHKSRAITENIRLTALRLSTAAGTTESEISQLACADRQKMAQLQAQVRETLGQLEGAHVDMCRSVADGNRRNEALAADIQEAILTMQFQDRLSQRIMHIVQATQSMQAELEKQLDPLGRSQLSPAPQSKAAELLADSYTMHGERVVHATALGNSHAAEEAFDDVEIF